MDKREQIAANGGASERTPRPLAGTALKFDFEVEAKSLELEEAWQVSGHNARTLIKTDELRVVLIALKAGARMQQHKTDQHVTVQALKGRLRLHLPREVIELAAGNLLALDRDVPHDVEGLEDSLFVLTMVWSKRRRPRRPPLRVAST